jgi:hypothetical protein
VTAIPSFVDGLGPSNLVPKLDLARLGALKLSADEGFVLSRVDGRTSLGEILLLVPFERATSVSLLRKLWLDGAIELPGIARPAPTPAPAPKPAPAPAAAASAAGLSEDQRKRIDALHDSLDHRDAFQLLEVERGASDKDVKRAYFRLSKEFHPDRFFGKEIGDYRAKVQKIFLAVKEAFELLSDKDRRAAYEESAGIK